MAVRLAEKPYYVGITAGFKGSAGGICRPGLSRIARI
ncbi:hypothetical protein OKW46_003112 [Paraburkholderia sp. WSM4179]|nr:hypothetical protein [Paraburkholderia sp. WSM4179]